MGLLGDMSGPMQMFPPSSPRTVRTVQFRAAVGCPLLLPAAAEVTGPIAAAQLDVADVGAAEVPFKFAMDEARVW